MRAIDAKLYPLRAIQPRLAADGTSVIGQESPPCRRRLNRIFHAAHSKNRRSGTVYIIVLFAAFLVAAVALASLNLARLQGQSATDGNDFIEARGYCRSAVEIGMLMIRNDPYWRTNLGNGVWATNRAIGAGTFGLSAQDPVDGDVTNGNNDPIILTAVGSKGRARYSQSVRIEVGPPAGSCFEVSMIAGNDFHINSAALTGNQSIAANDDVITGGSSTVNANVEAVDTVQGSGYAKTTATGVAVRTMPDEANCFNYYLTNGVTINYSDLPLARQIQFLTNTSFETDTSSWYAVGNAAISTSTLHSKDGTHSLLVNNRTTNTDTAAQDLAPISLSRLAAANGNHFNVVVPIWSPSDCTAWVVVTLVGSGGTQTFQTNQVAVGAVQWKDLAGTLTLSYSGSLTKATVSVAVSGTNHFYIDKPTFTNNDYPDNTYVIDRVLLAPTSNPFGSGQTNAQGIYVINCSNAAVQISNSRIVGTLVFVNPGTNSGVTGPVVWEPAVYNYPAILAQITNGGKINIGPSSAALSEASLGFNLNPAGCPYPYVGGSTNAGALDSYPSRISGLIYSSNDLSFSGSPTVAGVVVADHDIQVNATSLNISYGNVYLNDPPPGFTAGTISMKIVPGSWKRVVN